MIPGIDGFETCRVLKKNNATKNIPVIFMTALSDTVDKVKGFAAGGVDYITKPFQFEEVLARVNAHLTIQRLQKQLQQQKKQLEELNASKDMFFSILAHDLKSPMVVFLSYANLLDKIDSMKKSEFKVFTTKLQDTAGNLFALLENLLTWSTVQHGLIQYAPIQMNISSVIDENIKLMTPKASQKYVQFNNLVQEEIQVFADKNMLSTIIRNLLSNAVKFSHPGGTVKVSAVPDDDSVQICVSDEGVGIDKKNLSNLFRIDVRTKQPGTADEKGTGLGLILCREFAEKMGGSIEVESEELKGTTVRFSIPVSGK